MNRLKNELNKLGVIVHDFNFSNMKTKYAYLCKFGASLN